MLLGRMLSSVRYLATVRRAIGIPRLLKISTISLSLNGALPSSFLTRSRIASFTLVLLIDSPGAVWYPGVKKYLISNTPCDVAMYLPEMARLTVVSCTPTTYEMWTTVIGFNNDYPL